jgi:hypothetical protein
VGTILRSQISVLLHHRAFYSVREDRLTAHRSDDRLIASSTTSLFGSRVSCASHHSGRRVGSRGGTVLHTPSLGVCQCLPQVLQHRQDCTDAP